MCGFAWQAPSEGTLTGRMRKRSGQRLVERCNALTQPETTDHSPSATGPPPPTILVYPASCSIIAPRPGVRDPIREPAADLLRRPRLRRVTDLPPLELPSTVFANEFVVVVCQ